MRWMMIALGLTCAAALGSAAAATSEQQAWDGCVPEGIAVEQGFARAPDGTRLFFIKLGRGAPGAIYLHGGPGGTIYNGGCEIAPLARRHGVVLYDQRGGGRSDLVSDPGKLTVRHHVEDLDAIRRHFGAERVSLIGLSWGAALAGFYADAHPRHVSRLLLLAPMPVAKTPFGAEREAAILKAAGAELLQKRRELNRRMLAASSPEETIALCRQILEETPLPYSVDPARHRRHLTGCDYPAEVIRNRSVVARSTLESMGDWDLRPMLRRLPVPALVIEGTQSKVPLNSVRAWAETAPLGRLMLIEDAGHEVGLDQPERVRELADAFLSGGLPGTSGRTPAAD